MDDNVLDGRCRVVGQPADQLLSTKDLSEK